MQRAYSVSTFLPHPQYRCSSSYSILSKLMDGDVGNKILFIHPTFLNWQTFGLRLETGYYVHHYFCLSDTCSHWMMSLHDDESRYFIGIYNTWAIALSDFIISSSYLNTHKFLLFILGLCTCNF